MKRTLSAILLLPVCASAQKIELSANLGGTYLNFVNFSKSAFETTGGTPYVGISGGYKLKAWSFGLSADLTSIAIYSKYITAHPITGEDYFMTGRHYLSSPSASVGLYTGYSVSFGRSYLFARANAALVLGSKFSWIEQFQFAGSRLEVITSEGRSSGYTIGGTLGYGYRFTPNFALTCSVAPRLTRLNFKETLHFNEGVKVFQMPISIGAAFSF
jgi:hypothetical protein